MKVGLFNSKFISVLVVSESTANLSEKHNAKLEDDAMECIEQTLTDSMRRTLESRRLEDHVTHSSGCAGSIKLFWQLFMLKNELNRLWPNRKATFFLDSINLVELGQSNISAIQSQFDGRGDCKLLHFILHVEFSDQFRVFLEVSEQEKKSPINSKSKIWHFLQQKF
jgi:hypothetical protein